MKRAIFDGRSERQQSMASWTLGVKRVDPDQYSVQGDDPPPKYDGQRESFRGPPLNFSLC